MDILSLCTQKIYNPILNHISNNTPIPPINSFKTHHNLEDRKMESNRIKYKYPDRIPVIIENELNIPQIKNKYLVPIDLTVGQLLFVLRKRYKLDKEKALFMFINGIIPSSNSLIANLYNNNVDNDGFLYITVKEENVFGGKF